MVIARHVEFVIGSGWWNKPSFEYITDFGALIQWCSEGKSNRFIFNKVHDAGVIDSANCDFAWWFGGIDQSPSDSMLTNISGLITNDWGIYSALDCAGELSFSLLCDSAADSINLNHGSASVKTGSSNREILTTSDIARVGANIINGWDWFDLVAGLVVVRASHDFSIIGISEAGLPQHSDVVVQGGDHLTNLAHGVV